MRNINLCISACLLFILCLVLAIGIARAAEYQPTEKVLLNCGGPPESIDIDGRTWYSDIGSKFTSSAGNSATSPAATQDPSVAEVPYMTARLNPTPFLGTSVQIALGLNYAFFMKEFSVNVEGDTLNITFTPSTNFSNAYAFVNGIEILSMPDIYSSNDPENPILIVGTQTPFIIDNSTALENIG
ncbi:hypothetical protein L6164_002510 [Bauhinia variegata]|uniref:Uncharacterized protein n=1 Tax=Bauhinia variegata TaxID=167791 RepID=A0ACB9PYC1_BAUVA|nr:hypothetical protein L6164_002510 [Bauhinia variegata]